MQPRTLILPSVVSILATSAAAQFGLPRLHVLDKLHQPVAYTASHPAAVSATPAAPVAAASSHQASGASTSSPSFALAALTASAIIYML
ncbi:hypothetical protein HGRIS_009052 [Hohenbuehelia grisea]|uniref:Uncharacterized protein n=1 Tax=Hohenbuehelia grisea TaxID=104357 RepID=A0ABR3J0E3_9AGAR